MTRNPLAERPQPRVRETLSGGYWMRNVLIRASASKADGSVLRVARNARCLRRVARAKDKLKRDNYVAIRRRPLHGFAGGHAKEHNPALPFSASCHSLDDSVFFKNATISCWRNTFLPFQRQTVDIIGGSHG